MFESPANVPGGGIYCYPCPVVNGAGFHETITFDLEVSKMMDPEVQSLVFDVSRCHRGRELQWCFRKMNCFRNLEISATTESEQKRARDGVEVWKQVYRHFENLEVRK